MPANTSVRNVISKPSATPIGKAMEQLRNLLETSEQAIYLYVDDHNKACNTRFAQLLGYSSPDAWATVHTSFPTTFVAPDSQGTLVDTYQAAMNEGVAASVPVTWRRKDGKSVKTNVILAPIEVGGERLALHFITPA